MFRKVFASLLLGSSVLGYQDDGFYEDYWCTQPDQDITYGSYYSYLSIASGGENYDPNIHEMDIWVRLKHDFLYYTYGYLTHQRTSRSGYVWLNSRCYLDGDEDIIAHFDDNGYYTRGTYCSSCPVGWNSGNNHVYNPYSAFGTYFDPYVGSEGLNGDWQLLIYDSQSSIGYGHLYEWCIGYRMIPNMTESANCTKYEKESDYTWDPTTEPTVYPSWPTVQPVPEPTTQPTGTPPEKKNDVYGFVFWDSDDAWPLDTCMRYSDTASRVAKCYDANTIVVYTWDNQECCGAAYTWSYRSINDTYGANCQYDEISYAVYSYWYSGGNTRGKGVCQRPLDRDGYLQYRYTRVLDVCGHYPDTSYSFMWVQTHPHTFERRYYYQYTDCSGQYSVYDRYNETCTVYDYGSSYTTYLYQVCPDAFDCGGYDHQEYDSDVPVNTASPTVRPTYAPSGTTPTMSPTRNPTKGNINEGTATPTSFNPSLGISWKTNMYGWVAVYSSLYSSAIYPMNVCLYYGSEGYNYRYMFVCRGGIVWELIWDCDTCEGIPTSKYEFYSYTDYRCAADSSDVSYAVIEEVGGGRYNDYCQSTAPSKYTYGLDFVVLDVCAYSVSYNYSFALIWNEQYDAIEYIVWQGEDCGGDRSAYYLQSSFLYYTSLLCPYQYNCPYDGFYRVCRNGWSCSWWTHTWNYKFSTTEWSIGGRNKQCAYYTYGGFAYGLNKCFGKYWYYLGWNKSVETGNYSYTYKCAAGTNETNWENYLIQDVWYHNPYCEGKPTYNYSLSWYSYDYVSCGSADCSVKVRFYDHFSNDSQSVCDKTSWHDEWRAVGICHLDECGTSHKYTCSGKTAKYTSYDDQDCKDKWRTDTLKSGCYKFHDTQGDSIENYSYFPNRGWSHTSFNCPTSSSSSLNGGAIAGIIIGILVFIIIVLVVVTYVWWTNKDSGVQARPDDTAGQQELQKVDPGKTEGNTTQLDSNPTKPEATPDTKGGKGGGKKLIMGVAGRRRDSSSEESSVDDYWKQQGTTTGGEVKKTAFHTDGFGTTTDTGRDTNAGEATVPMVYDLGGY